MNKVSEWSAVLFGGEESRTDQAPVSPFLAQMWRRAGRANPGSVDPEERAAFAYWYIRHYYGHLGFQWPLPPALTRWLNTPAMDLSAHVTEIPGLRANRADASPKYLSRLMQHVAKTDGRHFDVSGAQGFFEFLAWYAFHFMPNRHIPPVLLPEPLLQLLNQPAEDERLPLTTGMLLFDKVSHPDRYQQLLEAHEAKLYAICYELMRDVLAAGNPRLIPAFVSAFWRSAATKDATAFDYVTQLVETRHPHNVQLSPDLPLSHLLSKAPPVQDPAPALTVQRPRSLSIVSYRDHTTVCGLAKSGAYAIESLYAAGIEIIDLDYNIQRKNLKQQALHNGRIFNNSLRNIHVFNLNPEHVLECALCNLSRIRENDYFIGQFYWELADICAIHEPSLSVMDEIWVASEFLVSAYRRRVNIPVLNMGTAALPTPLQRPYTRADFGLPEGDYLFLVNFDASSIVERKNPLAAVEAFLAAFPHGNEKAGLVIKTRNVTHITRNSDRKHWERTAKRIEKDRRIKLIDATLPEDAMTGLYLVTDCYVSLHRSEGFGNAPAEALYLGKPVIVTAFSGVCDFCSESTAKLVDYELIPVKPEEYPYLDSDRSYFWADPAIGTASRHMRELYENPAAGIELARQGQRLVRERYSRQALAQRYQSRLLELGFIAGSNNLS